MLGEFEQAVLIALFRLGANAYGASIQRDLEDRMGRTVSLSAVYATLYRLEAKGYLDSWIGEPSARRGGRRKRHFKLLPEGENALRSSYATYRRLIRGLERRLETL